MNNAALSIYLLGVFTGLATVLGVIGTKFGIAHDLSVLLLLMAIGTFGTVAFRVSRAKR